MVADRRVARSLSNRQAPGGTKPRFPLRAALGYPKAFRVRTSADHRAMRSGRRVRFSRATVLVREAGYPWARFGFAVSRKVGNAVVRNRVKRRLREVFRHLHAEFPPVDVVVIAKPGIDALSGEALASMLRDAVR